MELRVLNRTYIHNIDDVEAIDKAVRMELEDTGYFISHLNVDGREVYEKLDIFLQDNAEDIEIVEVVVKTKSEFLNDVLLLLETYLLNVNREVKKIIHEFYTEPVETTWRKFQEFLQGIQWINDSIETVDQSVEKSFDTAEFVHNQKEINNHLEELMNAVESNDHISTADIMQFEILPGLEQLQQSITTYIDQRGTRDDVN
ncbi:hypothetical protein [Salibacterium lacus]|uniref:DUF8042 domain-containing protein n=1 Tax=Salibacterium lacus TaxID=1898109 RepID=A0ABW5T258_9BACI